MRLRHLVLVVFACGVAASAQADERAWFFSNDSLTEVAVTAGGRNWTPVGSIALPPHSPTSPIVWGGGRYILWFASRPEGRWFVRFDTRSRQLAAFPLSFVPWAMAVERETTWIVVLASSAVYLVDLERLRVVMEFPLPPPQETESRTLAVARDGRIFVGRNTADGSIREVLVFSMPVGSQTETIPGVWYAQASRDGTRVYLQGESSTGVLAQVWDAIGMIATATLPAFAHVIGDSLVSEQLLPPSHDSVLLRAYDRNSLAMIAETVATLPHSARDLLELLQASPSSPFVLRSHSCYYGVCGRSIQLYEARTFTPVKQIWQAPFDTVGSRLLMLGPPDPPTGLHAVENSGRVFLSWTPPPDIGEYEVVIGSAPGLSDIQTIRTGGVARAVFGLPSGISYVRVRAINDLGVVESAERSIYMPYTGLEGPLFEPGDLLQVADRRR